VHTFFPKRLDENAQRHQSTRSRTIFGQGDVRSTRRDPKHIGTHNSLGRNGLGVCDQYLRVFTAGCIHYIVTIIIITIMTTKIGKDPIGSRTHVVHDHHCIVLNMCECMCVTG
jgi:hypothetical protein